MLNRPSSRRKSHQHGIELNLVPILDTMVTLIGFLLFTTSFLAIVSIESPLPTAAPEEVKDKVLEKPLQLTITLREKEIELSSLNGKVATQLIPNSAEGVDLKALHEKLIEVKKLFPKESNIVLVPTAGTAYESLIAIMDTLRTLEPTDPAIFFKNEKTGVDEPAKALFPNVIFAGLVGGT